MTIAPIVHTTRVKVSPARAFEIFTARMGDWWPKGGTLSKTPHTAIVVEPHVDGGWFERDAEGNRTDWGKVLAWEPPHRLLLAWQINCDWGHDPNLLTEVELTFAPAAEGGTLVTLEHRNLERFGTDAARHTDRLRGGWSVRVDDYARFADAQAGGNAPRIVVHSIPGSPFGRAVLAVLEEKHAAYQFAAVAPAGLKQQPHLDLHPFGRVPVLTYDDFALYETQAIVRFLDHMLPGVSLTPAEPRARARMDQVMSINDWYLFNGVSNVIGFQRIVGPKLMGLTPDEAVIAAAMPQARVVTQELGRLLGHDPYFAGTDPSLADYYVAPQVDFLAMTPEWTELSAAAPNLAAWLDRTTQQPGMRATTWEKVAAMATPGG